MLTTQQQTEDRRAFQRVPYGAWVEDLSRAGSLGFYLTRNLSKGGLLLKNPDGAAPAVGTRVRLRLIVENEQRTLTLDGQVVRHGTDHGGEVLFAVQFLALEPPLDSFLEDLVAELTAAQPRPTPSA